MKKRTSIAIKIFRSLQALSCSYYYLQVGSAYKSTIHIDFQNCIDQKIKSNFVILLAITVTQNSVQYIVSFKKIQTTPVSQDVCSCDNSLFNAANLKAKKEQ